MKIAFLVTSVLCSTILLSCSKGQSVLTTKDKLLGKWNIDSISSREVVNEVPNDNPAQVGRSGEYMEFRNNGTVYSSLGNKTSNWTLLIDTTMKLDDSPTVYIRELSKTKLYLYSKRVVSTTVYVEDKYFLHK